MSVASTKYFSAARPRPCLTYFGRSTCPSNVNQNRSRFRIQEWGVGLDGLELLERLLAARTKVNRLARRGAEFAAQLRIRRTAIGTTNRRTAPSDRDQCVMIGRSRRRDAVSAQLLP